MLSLVHDIRHGAQLLHGAPADFDSLLDRIGDARFVLIGEASHGTHDFYRVRAELTKRLIVEKGFHGVAIEADWPDAYRVNRYVMRSSADRDASEALAGFQRFPQWMWRNADMLDFVGWLRAHNDARREEETKVGIYGLDLYSLYGSIASVLELLDRVDPEAAERARERYACFEHYVDDPERYAYATGLGVSESCEKDAVAQLLEIRQRAVEWAAGARGVLDEAVFELEQNARVVRDAEEYYRNMFRGRVNTWNLRDRHMAQTLEELARHLDQRVGRSKVVVWEHNSHLGDARATHLTKIGEINVGQLVRERFGSDSVLVGFTTYDGTVTAANDWDGPAEQMRVRPGIPGSYEALFHATGIPSFMLVFEPGAALTKALAEPLQERAIGVIYRPRTERVNHYFEASLSDQFDVVIHLDHTRAVEPLERTPRWATLEPPETYPSAL